MAKLVCGVGINDLGKHFFYNRWRDMLCRCYDPRTHARRPTYVGCKVTPDWLRLSGFTSWAEQVPCWEGMHLDKDLLGDGSLYCPQFCVVIPPWLNLMFNEHQNRRGKMPLGVVQHGKRFYFQLAIDGKIKFSGKSFDTPELAHLGYRQAKAENIRSRYDQVRALHRGEELVPAIERRIASWGI